MGPVILGPLAILLALALGRVLDVPAEVSAADAA